ncbi:MAG TPA: phage tail protein, partial [Burkholderiales bacterium]|nr:phage tail protein [Burkholderiales bacterium]
LESAMLMADGKAWVSYQDTTPSHECRIALSDLYAETSTTLLTSAGDHFYLQGLGRNGAVWWKASGGAVLHRLQQSGVDQSATMSGFGTNQFGRIFEYDPDGEDDTLELYVEYHDQAAVGGVQIGGSLYRQHSFTFAGTTATKEQISTGADYTSIFWDGGRIAGRLYVSRRGAANHGFGYVDLETHAYVHLVTFANMPSRGLVGTDGNLYIQSGGANEAARIHKYDQAGALLDYVVLSTGMGATDYGLVTGMVMDDYGNLYVQRSATTRRFWKVETGTMTELDTGTQGTVNLVCGGSVFNGVAPVVTEDGDVFGAPSMLQLIEPARRVVATPPSAATIITALATRSPLVAGDLEVTDLSALTFDGYPVTRQGTIRELVEPLALAGFFDVTESDYKIKFVRRGGAAAVTIPQADLGARVLGASDEPPDPLTTTASGALDYPRMVHVTYMNPAADYQVGKQSSDRAGAGGMQEVNLNLPIVMSDDRARQIADKAKFEFLVAAEGAFDLTTGLDYTRYEPTDIANVTANDVTRRVRFLDRHEGADGVIVWKAVRDLAAVWTQAAPGAGADGQPPQTIPLKGPSEFELLDTHLLRDADDDPGFVLAMKGVTAEWPGGQLYQSDDAGVSWAAVPNGTVVVPAIFGRAVTALATFSALEGNELFDEANVVRVYVGAGVLASYTREQILAGTATGYLIGNELVYARTATLISTGVYDLSGLLRGRNGTEPYMSGHVVGETVVALTGELRSIEQSFADVDVARRYKAVTINQSIDSAVTRSFVNTARRKRPLAPWHAAAGRISASGDLRLKCVRRTRLKNLWRTGSDAPLGEAFERYTWNIYDGADIVRTLESDEPQVDYSAADQTTDFGGVLTTVDFDVAQVSGEYGLGYPTTASVTVA